jgi:hypothetical protein
VKGVRRKVRVEASYKPWPCLVLAADTAQRSGYSMWLSGTLLESGEFDLVREPFRVQVICEQALDRARAAGVKAVLVLEAPFLGTSQGQWRGAWRLAWAQSGGVASRVVQVHPSRWRARVLGNGMHAAKREVARKFEQRVAEQTAGYPVGEDEAPAIMIGLWATRAGEVGKKLEPRSKKGKAA